MKDKEKQIEEMAKDLENDINTPMYNYHYLATKLQPKGWVKLPEDSVVLSREEINNAEYFYVQDGELIPIEKGRGKFITTGWYKELLMKMPLEHELAKERKETAEKFARDLKSLFPIFDDKITFIIPEKLHKAINELAKQFGLEIGGEK